MTSQKRKESSLDSPEEADSDGKQDAQWKRKKPLDGWLTSKPVQKTKPEPFGRSSILRDKDSTFLAFASQAESLHDIKKLREYVIEVANDDFAPDEPASHVAHGARFLTLKAGKHGLDQSDFEVRTNSQDDGEERAGATIVNALAHANACDVVVCVSRWFGGTMLGPRRFDDIKQVALEALHDLRDQEALAEAIQTLRAKDNDIWEHLKRLNRLEGKMPPSPPDEDYGKLDLKKARRLDTARTARIANIQSRIMKLEKDDKDDLPDLPISKTAE